MILTYKHPPTPGTIVAHDRTRDDVKARFIAVDFNTFPDEPTDAPFAHPSVLRTAEAMEAYDIAQPGNGFEPRSIVEYFMLRRTWTVYGYAKVWGTTPEVARPKPQHKPTPHKQLSNRDMQGMIAEQQRKQERCVEWYRNRRGIPKQAPRDQEYIKMINEMYRVMNRASPRRLRDLSDELNNR
jgi:hypothetical protein